MGEFVPDPALDEVETVEKTDGTNKDKAAPMLDAPTPSPAAAATPSPEVETQSEGNLISKATPESVINNKETNSVNTIEKDSKSKRVTILSQSGERYQVLPITKLSPVWKFIRQVRPPVQTLKGYERYVCMICVKNNLDMKNCTVSIYRDKPANGSAHLSSVHQRLWETELSLSNFGR